ncbi:Phosphoheptose isomerase [Paenibacillus allorhizoplanae]|uniref:Phosphoheptose isomerase n=1 Tax=Paenibacillus allorhizoplanae TaxID=2905648 RepID=A0ABN8H4V3_9BACL|nr:D-sedoheptulose 7-phosphate isomerase [Paenibacillus allorhizoplanae]CAH1228654.1 Phosphoheptose isomerase [Paenibacillus allorhizoplanae]
MKAYISSEILRAMEIKRAISKDSDLLRLIEQAARKMIEVYRNGNKIMLGGNGGSAADAQHIAGEFVSRFYFDRPGLPCIALTTDSSILTAIGNDYGYEQLFARQIQANGQRGDIFIGISTSGNSPNVIRGLEMCRAMGITTIGLTGESGGRMAALCDICIRIPSQETPRIQEAHILIGHILCAIVEESIFGKGF